MQPLSRGQRFCCAASAPHLPLASCHTPSPCCTLPCSLHNSCLLRQHHDVATYYSRFSNIILPLYRLQLVLSWTALLTSFLLPSKNFPILLLQRGAYWKQYIKLLTWLGPCLVDGTAVSLAALWISRQIPNLKVCEIKNILICMSFSKLITLNSSLCWFLMCKWNEFFKVSLGVLFKCGNRKKKKSN